MNGDSMSESLFTCVLLQDPHSLHLSEYPRIYILALLKTVHHFKEIVLLSRTFEVKTCQIS
jgi:hypothetical protein